MSLILSGTDGLSDVDGSAATPAIRGSDANTGIFFPAADTIAFSEGGVESMRLDSAGNLGIGTSSPSSQGRLVVKASGTSTGQGLAVQASGNDSFLEIRNTGSAHILSATYNSTGSYQPIAFFTSDIERARILTNGQFNPGADNSYGFGGSGIRWAVIWAANGTIQTSDARQKNSITDSDLGLSFIGKLRPVSYKWNVGQNIISKDENGNDVTTPRPGVRTHYGLIAQEVKEALGDKDFGGFIHDKNTDEMGLRYDQFIAPLIRAIQEQQGMIQELNAKVEAQAAEIAALKAQ